MKKLTFSVLALSVHFLAHAETFYSDAPVVAAKLYTQEAELTREVKIQLPAAGQHQIIVNPLLSNNIGDISPHIVGAKILSQGTHALFKQAKDEEPIWQKLDQAQHAFTAAKQAVDDNKQLVDALIKRITDPTSDIEQVEKSLATLQEARQSLLAEVTVREKALQALQAELQWLGKKRENVAQTAIFSIQAEQAGEVILTFQEKTPHASWQPYSELHLQTKDKQLTLRAGAKIVQNTGLDWQNVPISLAVTPLNYSQRPELQTTTVAVADKIVAKEEKNLKISALQELKTFAAPVGLIASYPEEGVPEIINNGIDFEVKLPDRYSFLSGGDRHQVPYLEESTPADIYSGVYAWDQPEALLIGEWTQPIEAGFIPGETAIYRDDNRLASLYFSDVWAGGAKHVLSFGKDPQIEVNYHTPPGYTAGSGIIIKDKILEKRENIHVKNLSPVAKNIHVYSRIPVTTQQEVSVEEKFTPQPTATHVDGVKGIYLWKKTLSTGQSLDIESGYDIRYPEGKRLIGLD